MKTKKIVLVFTIIAILSVALIPSLVCFADEKPTSSMEVSSREALLMEYETGTVVFEKNSTDPRPIASMTKIMTLLCVYDAVDEGKISLNDNVVISDRAGSMGGSQAFLDAGSQHSVENLIKTVIICSANDSSVALAEHVSGSVESFVDLMNKKSQDLGLVNTYFVNCTGLPAVNQFSCASDVAVMMRALLRHDNFFKYSGIWMEDYAHPSGRVTGLTNTNKLVRFYEGCDGGKTGFTAEAMHCLCATAKRNGIRFISVIIGAPDSKTRFAESQKLLNYAFANYESKPLLSEGEKADTVEVRSGKISQIDAVAQSNLALFGKKGTVAGELLIELDDNVKAPIAVGDKVGTAYIVDSQGKKIAQVNLVSNVSVDKKSFFDYLKDIVGAK